MIFFLQRKHQIRVAAICKLTFGVDLLASSMLQTAVVVEDVTNEEFCSHVHAFRKGNGVLHVPELRSVVVHICEGETFSV